MVLTEEQLRKVVYKTIAEAISRQDARLASRYANAGDDKFTLRQNYDGAMGAIRNSFGARKDSNGQYGIEQSANEIAGLIQQYKAELRKLRTASNYLQKRINGEPLPQRKTYTRKTDAEKQAMAARRAQRQQIMQRYGDINGSNYQGNYGSFTAAPRQGYKSYAADKNAAQGLAGSGWMNNVNVNEGIGNWFRNGTDEVDQLVASYRNIPQEQWQDALNKINQRIQEYQGILEKLQARLQGWEKNGSVVDKNAELRRQRNAELRGLSRTPSRAAANAINEAVENAIKKYLNV